MGEGCERWGRVVSGGSIESSRVLVARERCHAHDRGYPQRGSSYAVEGVG